MAKLSASQRKALPKSDFAVKSKAGSASGKAASGSYPIPDKGHAKAALSRVAQHGTPSEKAQVRAAVAKKFPGMGRGGSAGGRTGKGR